MKKIRVNWKVLMTSLAIVFFFAVVGSVFTLKNINSLWYQSIEPFLTPPSWVFSVVWTVLFLMIALSMHLSWMSSRNKKVKNKISMFFAINLLLNVFWSYIFFVLQNTRVAFFELLLLWLSIIAMIVATYKVNRISSYLLIPYLLWVTFAGYLNWIIIG